MFNSLVSSIKLPEIEVRVIQETFLAGSSSSNTLFASSDGSPVFVVICRDHLHLIKIDPMKAIDEEPL